MRVTCSGGSSMEAQGSMLSKVKTFTGNAILKKYPELFVAEDF